MAEELGKIFYECIASKLDEMTSHLRKRNYTLRRALITTSRLDKQAKSMNYQGLLSDLVNFANRMEISNENGEFEERVINPIKRAQGIYLFNTADSIDISNENGEFEEKVIGPMNRLQGIYHLNIPI